MNCSFVAPEEVDFIILKVGSDFLPPAKGFKIGRKWQRTLKAWLCLTLLKQPSCTREPGRILEHSQIWTLMLLRVWSLEIPETQCRTMQDTNKPKETWPMKCMSHPACVISLWMVLPTAWKGSNLISLIDEAIHSLLSIQQADDSWALTWQG